MHVPHGSRIQNPLCRPARTRAGFDVVIRVLAIGQSGQDHVEILNALTRGDFAFFSANHAIPLYEFITFEDITFGIFPMVGSRVEEAYGYWAKNSVGDVVDMLLQCLEVREDNTEHIYTERRSP